MHLKFEDYSFAVILFNHTQTRAHALTYSNTHAHTLTHTHTRARIHIFTLTRAHTSIYKLHEKVIKILCINKRIDIKII